MLTRSFVHLPGIGAVKEKRLWDQGVLEWNDAKRAAKDLFKPEKALEIAGILEASERARNDGDLSFFFRSFPRDQLWRLIPECGGEIAYLDIETTGTGFPPFCHSTTITFYFRGEVLQQHDHAKKLKLIKKISREARLWVTFFGDGFDLPFLRREFDLALDSPHIDLCFWLKRLGYKGGLKKVQKLFPEIPQRLSLDIDGFDAVRLWRMHRKGVPGALETLLTYNAEDTIVLEPLLVRAFNLELERHPELGGTPLPSRALPELKTGVSLEVYRALRGEAFPSLSFS